MGKIRVVAATAGTFVLGMTSGTAAAVPAGGAAAPVLVTVTSAEGLSLATGDVALRVVADAGSSAVAAKGLESRFETKVIKEKVGKDVRLRLPATAVAAGDFKRANGIVDFEIWVRDTARRKQGFTSLSLVPISVGGTTQWRVPESRTVAKSLVVKVSSSFDGLFCVSTADCANLAVKSPARASASALSAASASKAVERSDGVVDFREVGQGPAAPVAVASSGAKKLTASAALQAAASNKGQVPGSGVALRSFDGGG